MVLSILQIAKRTIFENLKIKNNLIYFAIVIIFAILFNLGISSYLGINEIEASIASNYFVWALLISAGAPFLIYICYIASGSINKELNSGTALMLFTRPLSRKEFIIGKFLGILGYIAIINAFIFLFVPTLMNLFFGASTNILPIIWKLSLVFYVFSILFSTIFVSISILFSTIFKHSITVFLIMIGIILALYILPIINESALQISIIPNIVKPVFASTVSVLIDSGNVSNSISFISTAYGDVFYKIDSGISNAPQIIVQNYTSSLTLFLVITVVLSIIILIVAMSVFSKKDIA